MSLLMGLAAQLWAAPVGRTQALKNAQSFLQQRGLAGQTRLQYKAPRNAQSQDDAAAYYIFNIGNNQGFVVVSGDDRTEQILGYADNGTFDEQHMPSNMKAWLQSYADQIQALDRQGVTTAQRAPRKSPTRRAIAPMVTSRWNQDAPYNNACPEYFDEGVRCMTGCVATAMAQILYYHREESKDNDVWYLQDDIAGFDCETYRFDHGGYVHVDGFSAEDSPIDWDNMLDEYKGETNWTQQEAVANLMAYCGASVEMDYGSKSSGASAVRVAGALKTYFGYDEATTYVVRSQYSIAEWDNLIYNELREGRPVFYGGRTGGNQGHAFVVDGCDADGYYHINWGWAGDSDGYFLLASCEPESSGIGGAESGAGYSLEQHAVIGAQPDTGSAPVVDLALDALDPQIDGTTVSYTFLNRTGETHIYNCGIGYIDPFTGKAQLIKPWIYLPLEFEAYDMADDSFTLTLEDFANAGLSAGEYTIVPMCQVVDNEEWMKCNTFREIVEAQYDPSTSSLVLVKHAPIVNLTADNFEFNGDLLLYEMQPVKMKITNHGDEFNGAIYLFASTTATPGECCAKTGVAVAKGATVDASLSFYPTEVGEYNIWVATDEDCENVIGQATVTIEGNHPERNLALASFNVDNAELYGGYADYYKLLGNRMVGHIELRNDASVDYKGDIVMRLHRNDTGEQIYEKTVKTIIELGSTATIPFDYRDLDYEVDYFVMVWYDDYAAPLYAPLYRTNPAVMTTLADGTIVASEVNLTEEVSDNAVVVDFTGVAANIEYVYANDNPNTIYIVGEDEPLPDGLDEKNIVRGNTAEEITLTDGYDFMVTKPIYVDHISYNRTFDYGTDAHGSGWQTLVLPFAPTEIMADGWKHIDWFHSRNDINKDFWLMEFSESVGTRVIFDYAQSLDANIPYIIAVPDNTWGDEWDLRGQEITFTADDVALLPNAIPEVSSDVYKFIGTMCDRENTQAYGLNYDGSRFEQGFSEQSAFRAFFLPKTVSTSMPQSLSVAIAGDTSTAIAMPQLVNGQAAVYNLQGVRVAIVPVAAGQADLSTLPKGVYIVNGKKVIK